MIKFFYSCLCMAIAIGLHAQSTDKGTYHVVGANLHASSIIVHSKDVAAVSNSYPVATSFYYMFQYVRQSAWDLCLCSPKAGFGLEFWSFDNNRILGYGLSPTLILEPVFIGSGRLHFSIRLVFGVPYLTKPFDSISNPQNLSYSSNIALYGSMGGQLNYQLNENWMIHLGAGYNHISSGGITEPNKGINFPTALAGVSYAPRPLELSRFEKTDWRQSGKEANRFGFELFGTLIRKVDDTWYMVGGSGLHYLKRVSRVNSIGAHAEIVKQGAHKASALPGQTNFVSIGIAPTNEIILGRFLFSQSFGFYLKKSDIEKRDVYQRYVLNFEANRWLLLGLGLRAHGHVADFLDVRLSLQHMW